MFESVLGLLSGVPGAIADYFNEKQKIAAAHKLRELEYQEAVHVRRVELIKAGLHADATWEIEQIRSSGWKDEYVLLVLSIPLVGCFIPGLDTYVAAGFKALEGTPTWYQFMIPMIFGACFGIRMWRRQQYDSE